MTEKTLATLILMVGGAMMIFARRWKNKDNDAGIGIVIVIGIILLAIWA